MLGVRAGRTRAVDAEVVGEDRARAVASASSTTPRRAVAEEDGGQRSSRSVTVTASRRRSTRQRCVADAEQRVGGDERVDEPGAGRVQVEAATGEAELVVDE